MRRVAGPLAVVIAVTLAAAGCSADDQRGVARPDGSLDWRGCGAVECARLDVPIDRDDPAGPTVSLALARHRADGDRIGVLLVNPGGPGAPALEYARYAEEIFPAALTDRFDIVAWDPRGTGSSDPVDCVDDAAMARWWAADRSPDDPADRAELLAAAEAIADGCAGRTSELLLAHLSTLATVDDLDAIRAALGEAQISYLGFSYGTVIGAYYAQRYGPRVRAMVLDGAVDPALSVEELVAGQARGFERALDAFLAGCAADAGCAFHSGGDPGAAYDRLMAGVDAEPVYAVDAAGNERAVGPGEADLGVAAALYLGHDGWSQLADALASTARGDGSPLLALADQYAERDGDGHYDDALEASYAIGCVDGPQPSVAETEELAGALAGALPRFGPTTAWYGVPCAFWEVPPDPGLPAAVVAAAAPPIVVVGTTNDPASPYEWAVSLARRLASGVLVTHEGEGHTAYLRGDDCIDDAVHAALVELVPPADGTRC